MFRFTIRDLLWLMVVVGLLTLWLIEHGASRQLSADNEAFKAKIFELEDRLNLESPGRKLIEKNAYEHGVRKGAETERADQASRDEERRRSLLGVPPSQKEAGPGVYFLQ